MTPEQKFREVGTWLWLAGFSIEEAEGRIGKMNRAELRTAVRAGFVECAARWAFRPVVALKAEGK